MNVEDPIDRVFNFIKAPDLPKFKSVDAAIVLSEFYDMLYKIHNHADLSRPMSSVAHHDAEEVVKNSRLEQSIKAFAIRNIKDVFGLNYMEYISLPSYVCDILSEVALDALKRKAEMSDEVQKELNSFDQQK